MSQEQPNVQVLEQIFHQIQSDLTAMKTDVKDLASGMSRLEVEMAGYGMVDLKADVKSNNREINELKAFKNKMLGAIIIMNGVWAIVAAVLIGLIMRAV